MVTIVKHEWHSHDRQYAIELDEDLLSEIYPDMKKRELKQLLKQIEIGEVDVEEVIDEAYNNDVDIEWDFQYDDCWTDRKGGYDVTYELGDESSWVDNTPDPSYHKCTKCRWEGGKYETLTAHLRDDGSIIEDYYASDEESNATKEVCPMCDSEVKLTEFGEKEEQERKERQAKWDKEWEEMEEAVPCFSCGLPHKESKLPELNGQYYCPDCNEGWVMADSREENQIDETELEEALEELKTEFEELMQNDGKAKKKKKK